MTYYRSTKQVLIQLKVLQNALCNNLYDIMAAKRGENVNATKFSKSVNVLFTLWSGLPTSQGPCLTIDGNDDVKWCKMMAMMMQNDGNNDGNGPRWQWWQCFDIPHLQLTETPVVWSLPEQWLWSTLFLTMNFGQLFFFTMDFEVTLLYNDGLWSTLFDNLVLKPAKDVFSHLLN